MKTFKQFLNEESLDVDELAKKIKSDCQPFLSLAHDYPLLRGVKQPGTELFSVAEQPKDRAPLDSDKMFNVMFNYMAEQAFGVKDIRRSSLFCTGDPSQASVYGDIFFVFPRGDFKFIWSPHLYDSVSASTKFYDGFIERLFENLNIKPADGMRSKSIAFWRLISDHLTENTLVSPKAISYYLEEAYITHDHSKDVVGAVQRAAGDTFDKLYLKVNIKLGIKQQHEILVFESGGFYLVNVKKLAEALNFDLKSPKLKIEQLDSIYDELLKKIHE